MKNNTISRILTAVLGLLLCSYIGYQLYRSLYDPVRTVSAVFAEVDDSVPLDGCVVRDESIITKDYGAGVLETELYEGERAANGSVIATIYTDQNAADKSHEAFRLQTKIDQLKTLYSQSGETYDLDSINSKISEDVETIVSMRQDGVFTGAATAIDNLKLRAMLREYIYRNKDDLLKSIEELEKEKSALNVKNAIKNRIFAPHTGYYSRYSDGYESVLGSQSALTMKPSEFLAASEGYAEADKNSVGKLITNNKWYFVSVIPEEDAKIFKEGAPITLKFSDRSLPDAPCKTERVSEAEDGKVLVAISCTSYIGNFTKPRKLSAQAVVKTYSGLKVPRSALRVDENGQNGVYCLVESQVKFKPIEIIFEKDSYYIAAYDSSDTKSLLLYDSIIVSAKNLENKKIIK